jgi:hypothetical protein
MPYATSLGGENINMAISIGEAWPRQVRQVLSWRETAHSICQQTVNANTVQKVNIKPAKVRRFVNTNTSIIENSR